MIRTRARRITVMMSAGLIAMTGAYAVGIRLNSTASMPRGVWRVLPVSTVSRGNIVTACLPVSKQTILAVKRAYLQHGRCPSGLEPVVKPVAAVMGDVVTVTAYGVAVNGSAIPNTEALPEDSAGRPLAAMPQGNYRVSNGEIWLIAPANPRSWDSRYFGPVPVSAIQGAAQPLWVMP